MAVSLNHTIVWCRDQQKSAGFLTEILDRPAAVRFGPLLVVELDNGASLDFYQRDGKISLQHYAFLIGAEEFDSVFAERKRVLVGKGVFCRVSTGGRRHTKKKNE